MSITGAGILIMELYKTKPVIILFGFDRTNYSDPGGTLNVGELPIVGACRECREESGNLINIKPNELQQMAIPVIVGEYVSYVIYVQNVKAKDYIYNINKIFTECTDRSWKETNSFARVHLSDIIMSANNYSNYVNDIYGLPCFVRGRIMHIIRQASSTLSIVAGASPVMLMRNFVMQSRMPCLIGTYSYTIMYQNMIVNNVKSDKKYAIYVLPDNEKFLRCGKSDITHIVVTNYSGKYRHERVKDYVDKLVRGWGNIDWTMNVNSVKIKNGIVYFKSRTLDKVASYLHKHKFRKVHDQKLWSIVLNCPVPEDIYDILRKVKWQLCIVSQDKVLDHYYLKKM